MLEAIVSGYDITDSKTLILLKTCCADKRNGRLIVSSPGEVSDQDWAVVLELFPPTAEYEYDFAIIDGMNVISILDVI